MLSAACTPSPNTPDAAPPPVLDGGALHNYRCPLDGGLAWTCSDGLTTPVGSCPSYCVPVP
jgi:hypothetical protein